ncbi:MAG: T9SS type B sorting domain-containing protein [Bacteroidetes bacterium]|nr:T9SS type B sorting domain-containing protein [Bacteroidota bacterium]
MRMRQQFLSYFLIVLLAGCFFKKVNAQTGLCPSNLDIELGDFTGWTCRYGVTSDPLPLPGLGVVPGRHTIINSATAGLDPYGFFPEMCPNGSNFCVKLGNSQTGAQAESVSYTYTIPSTVSNFSMLFYYAVVLQDPGHVPANQPRFMARIVDVATGLPLACVNFDFIASGSLPGFQPSPVNPQVLFKDWTPISINLNAYIGSTIMLEFITKDCSQTGHFGYAYFDVGTVCNGAITGNFICPGDNSITLTAPFGFQGYRWFADMTFPLPPISTTQTVTLAPPPAVGSIFPVEITPYPGYGCLDTLYAIVDVGTRPPAIAGPDRVICNGTQVQIGGPPLPAHSYSWIPAALVSNPSISNPFAGPVSVPTEFIVTVTDILTGCENTDTTVVSNFVTDTAVTRTGNISTCINETRATLSVNNISSPVQWYEATAGPIPGATGINYTPTVSGTYWAEITQGGCLDSTGLHNIFIHPLPVASFTASSDTACVTNNSFTFTNTSSTPDNANMTYLWRFNDGVTDISTNAIRTINRVGTYNVKLVTTTEFGCKDSTAVYPFYVMPNGRPDFTWDSICTSVPTRFTNLSIENGSPQAWYNWNFANGDPAYLIKNPPFITYNTQPGQADVILKMATLGCENDTQTVVKTVQVNRQVPGFTYRTITVPEGSSKWLHVRDTIGNIYNWRPAVQLSSYNTQYTEFFAVDDVRYLIDITDKHTCITTDTIQMLVLKKPGFYLPTAFTPNNDGLNDLARPYLIGMKGLKSFSVFHRNGQLLYFTQTYGHGWDGKYKGVDQSTGVFVWVLEYYDSNNKLVMEKGTITLIR